MADPLGVTINALYSRLSSKTIGFNQAYAAIYTNYVDLTTGQVVPGWVVDWTATSTNFVYGMVPADLIEETSPLQYPLITISADMAAMDPAGGAQRVHYSTFSGIVQCVVQAILTWEETSTRDFESWPNAVSDAMFQTIANKANIGAWQTGLPAGTALNWTGNMNVRKQPIAAAGSNWRREVIFTPTFRLLVA